MAVGRHRAVHANGSDADGEGRGRPTGTDPAAANHELLGWGVFLAVTAAAAMGWAGIGWPVITGCTLLLLVSFGAVWWVQRDTGHSPAPTVAVLEPAAVLAPESRPAPATLSTPAAPLSGPAADAAPPTRPATGGADDGTGSAADSPGPDGDSSPLTRKQMRAADPTTGLLPVVPMFGRAVPAAPAPAQKGLEAVVPGGRRERRHAATTAPATDSQAPTPAADSGASTGPAAPVRPGTAAGTGARSTFGPVIIQATVYEPVPEPAVPDAAAGAASPAAGESRWTRTFGPPETGQLPIQQYVAGPTGSNPADPLLPDRRQRSHSSL